jgi:formylglycine-generating enzyme required for sulfatase activity
MLRHGEDPRTRSYLIHRLASLGADPRPLVARLDQESNISARRALLLCLGEYGTDQLPAALRETMLPALLGWYRDDPDPGLHAAAEWLLRTWGQTKALAEINRALREERQRTADREPSEGRRWYVTSQGHTMVVIQGGRFLMGSPASDPDRKPEETLCRKRIDRRYALSSVPITREQYRAYQEQSEDDEMDIANNPQINALVRTDDSPIMALNWYEAAAYCNWLSQKEGIPEDQWCYLRNGDGKYKSGMRVRENTAALSGYRLPTQAEREYACRAGAVTRRYFGHGDDLLSYYAWYADNSHDRAWPVATKKPNDFGLFDMHGHVFNWCQTKHDPQHTPEVDEVPGEEVLDTDNRVLCGMSSMGAAKFARSANHSLTLPVTRVVGLGFRVARTCP